jgi:hypothetical protein
VGHTSSVHNSWSFRSTHIFKEHERVLAPGEWIWADSAYPSEMWCVSPFKKPIGGKLTPDQWTYNYHVSQVHQPFLSSKRILISSRFAFVLNMPSGFSRVVSKHCMNSRFKSLRQSTTNGPSFSSSRASSSITSYSNLREATSMRVSTNTFMKLADGTCRHCSMTSRREKVATRSCNGHVGCNVPTGRLSDLDTRGCLSGSTTTKYVSS